MLLKYSCLLLKVSFYLFKSAGVGRTGTYIACDLLLKSIDQSEKLNIFKTVLHLRKQRTNMVQTQVTFWIFWLFYLCTLSKLLSYKLKPNVLLNFLITK